MSKLDFNHRVCFVALIAILGLITFAAAPAGAAEAGAARAAHAAVVPATPAIAVAPAAGLDDLIQAAGAPAVHCTLDLGFLGDLSTPLAESTPADATSIEALAKPVRHGYCRCSCGYPCKTSADCGGASCDPFITCC